MSTLPPYLAALGSVLGPVVIVTAVLYLVRVLARARLFDVPVAESCELPFPASGSVVLHVEGPRRCRRRPGLELALFDPMAGSSVTMKKTLPSRIGGAGRSRFAMRRFEIGHPGVFRLDTGRLEKLGDVSQWQFVLARPTGPALPLGILAIVAGSLMLLFGLLAIFVPGALA